jgi:hypothetical protein
LAERKCPSEAKIRKRPKAKRPTVVSTCTVCQLCEDVHH